MISISKSGKKVKVTRTYNLPAAESFPARKLQNDFEFSIGVDFNSPAGAEIFEQFQKDLTKKLKKPCDDQDARLLKTYQAVAKVLKTPSKTPAKTLEVEIKNSVDTWYNYSKNGIPKEAKAILADTAKSVQKKYKDAVDTGKIKLGDPSLKENRVDVLKNLLGVVAGVGAMMTNPIIAIAGFATIVSSSAKLSVKWKELGDKRFKPTALSLSQLTKLTGKLKSDTERINKHLDLVDKLGKSTRAAMIGQLGEAANLQTALTQIQKKASGTDAKAEKQLQKLSSQLEKSTKRAEELNDQLVETDDIKTLMDQAHRLISQADTLAKTRAKASSDSADKAAGIIKEISVVADVLKAIT